tara:strand:+ start:1295 stop:1495 length:201 start_codon:yes stop_codon:yes gene_type:complete
MSYLTHLKRSQIASDTRWIVKLDKTNGKVREVKQIFDPADYRKFKNPRTLYNKEQLIKILEDDKKK